MPAQMTTKPSSWPAGPIAEDMTAAKVRDSSGRSHQLSKVIGRGGEATVYRIAGNGDLLAKIYTKPNTDREQKLTWMIANPPEDPAASRFSSYLRPFSIL